MKQSFIFLFQVGGVHPIISQSRSTRDLWSGSYLVAWHITMLVRQLQQTLQEAGGECDFIFPSAPEKHLPLLSWLKSPPEVRKDDNDPSPARQSLIPRLSNRVVAKLTGDPKTMRDLVLSTIHQVFSSPELPTNSNSCATSEWGRVSSHCQQWLKRFIEDAGLSLGNGWEQRWHNQVKEFWDLSWQLSPLDEKNPWDTQFCHADRLFNASRSTRTFSAWSQDSSEASRSLPRERDAITGKEPAILDRELCQQFQELLTKLDKEDKSGRAEAIRSLAFLFRHAEPLGAIMLIKRLWWRAHLCGEQRPNQQECCSRECGYNFSIGTAPEDKGKSTGADLDIPSIPGIAAAPWFRTLVPTCPALLEFAKKALAYSQFLPFDVPKGDEGYSWLCRADLEILQTSFWEQQEGKEERKQEVLDSLKNLIRQTGSAPSTHYAFLCMDGDQFGQWVSGHYLSDLSRLETWQHTLGSTLLNLAETVRNTIENWFMEDREKLIGHGKLVLTGGEDILAIVPASEAIPIAEKLAKDISAIIDRDIRSAFPEERFPEFTFSAGIAIAHMTAPLQDMVEAAEQAMATAKSPAHSYRDQHGTLVKGKRIYAHLFKRSGSQIQWTAQFGSRTLSLYQLLDSHWDELPNRLPQKLVSLLSLYQDRATDGSPLPLKRENMAAILAEFQWLLGQGDMEDFSKKDELLHQFAEALEETHAQQLPLDNLTDTFLVHSFIRRNH